MTYLSCRIFHSSAPAASCPRCWWWSSLPEFTSHNIFPMLGNKFNGLMEKLRDGRKVVKGGRRVQECMIYRDHCPSASTITQGNWSIDEMITFNVRHIRSDPNCRWMVGRCTIQRWPCAPTHGRDFDPYGNILGPLANYFITRWRRSHGETFLYHWPVLLLRLLGLTAPQDKSFSSDQQLNGVLIE